MWRRGCRDRRTRRPSVYDLLEDNVWILGELKRYELQRDATQRAGRFRGTCFSAQCWLRSPKLRRRSSPRSMTVRLTLAHGSIGGIWWPLRCGRVCRRRLCALGGRGISVPARRVTAAGLTVPGPGASKGPSKGQIFDHLPRAGPSARQSAASRARRACVVLFLGDASGLEGARYSPQSLLNAA